MTAKEAYEMSSRGAQNQAEQQIILACEKGQNECSMDRLIYDKCKQWLDDNGYRTSWIGFNGTIGITWAPIEIKEVE